MKSCEKFVSETSEYYVYSPSRSAQEMFFYLLQCGHFIYEAGYFLQRDHYDSLLLMHITKGTLTLEYDNTTHHVTEGHFVLIDCAKPHAYYSDLGWECIWCHFDGVLALSWYESIVSHLGYVFSLTDPYPSVNKLHAIFDLFHSCKIVSEPLLSKYLTDILTAFLMYTPKEVSSTNYATIAEEVITYINEHFREPVSVKELADFAGLSQYHFIRIFKQETGFTPHEYIINIRMTTAKYLLKNSNLTIKDICFDCGFSGESVFCSAFKRHQGMTPAQYREGAV